MIELDDETGPAAMKEGQNYLLMFYADWCPLCPPLIDTLDGLQKSENGKFEFAKINQERNPEAAEFFDIPGVPMVLAIKGKAVLAGWAGFTDEEMYRRVVDIAFDPPDKELSQSDLDALNGLGEEYKSAWGET